MYVSKEQVKKAREMDLFTYLTIYEPHELVEVSRNVYSTKSHDSLKISNGKWYWWSQGYGGSTALDYLVKVCGMPFPDAVMRILGEGDSIPVQRHKKEKPKSKELLLPPKHANHRRVFSYLLSRGIDAEIINHCIKHDQLYEDSKYHNCVFVGFCGDTPKYAALRGTLSDSTFVGEVEGSDKHYAFTIPKNAGENTVLYVFESAIDAMSYLTLAKMEKRDWRKMSALSLGGVQRIKTNGERKLPDALAQYLKDYDSIETIVLCLDNDTAGKTAADAIYNQLSQYEVEIAYPKYGKDYNEYLQMKRGIKKQVKMRGREER